jgi:uncharacterized protein
VFGVKVRLAQIVDQLLGLPAAESPLVDVRRDVRIPLPDGVQLLADRYRPRSPAAGPGTDHDGPLPVVLIRTPYGHHTVGGRLFGSVLARRGFQVVVQSVRGTFGSGGEFRPFHDEKDDGLATVAWLRAQPWCDGRVATAGPSYLGHTQWALGPYLDPPLEAMCLGITASDFVSSFYPGGALGLYSMLWWSALIGIQEHAPFGGLLPNPRRLKRTARAMSHLPVRDGDLAAIGRRVGFLQEVVEHTEGDGFWTQADHSASVPGLTTPTSMVSGWYDLFLPAQLNDFSRLAAAGRTTRITIGPWFHGERAALKAILNDSASWLAAHLDNDVAQLHRPPVRLHLQNADRWLDFDRWPPTESLETSFHLHGRRRLSRHVPASSNPDVFIYDPADPTPSTGGPLLSGKAGRRDQRATEGRPDVLVYTGAALDHDLDVIGEVRATIHLRTEREHADVFVRLCDVDPAGHSKNVTDGIIRLTPNGEPGAIRVAEVELFPTAYRFRRGHRLRVQVAGGAFPRFARNHGTGEPAADAVATVSCRFEVLHDPDHPSRVILPLLRRDELGETAHGGGEAGGLRA